MLEYPNCKFVEHDDFPGHKVFENGSIWSCFGNKEETSDDGYAPLKASPDKDGYLSVKIDGRTKDVHNLVCTAFHGPKPEGQEVRHLDGNNQNNWAWNLKWGTKLENRADQKLHGTESVGEKHYKAAFNDEEIKKIIIEYTELGSTQSEIAEKRNVSQACISRILSGKRRKKNDSRGTK